MLGLAGASSLVITELEKPFMGQKSEREMTSHVNRHEVPLKAIYIQSANLCFLYHSWSVHADG